MRFLLSGYYGFGNLGDEALLQVIVAQLRTRYPYAEIDVLSAQPEATARELNVEATPRADVRLARQAIAKATVVLSGGGGLLQNITSLRSLLYYVGIVRSAIAAGRPTMIFAQSVGPLDFVGKQVVRRGCRGVTAATVRDEGSRVLLADLLAGVTVERSADPVFLYDVPETGDVARHGITPDRPLAVVSVRPTDNFAAGADRIAAAVDRLAACGVSVAFVPFGGAEDADASTVVMRKCRSSPVLIPIENFDDAASIVARAAVLIGIRLHALILAVRLGIPFLAVPYDPKVSGLCDDIAYPLAPLWVPRSRAPARPAAECVDELWNRREELAGMLAVAATRMRALAEKNFTVLDRVVGAAANAR